MSEPRVIKKRFGTVVRRLRTERDLSQDEFASLVGIHRTYIGGIERGERNPTLTMIMRIAAALNVDASTLLRGGQESK
jgi:transcriptional regulator with XRE-family HTH domain